MPRTTTVALLIFALVATPSMAQQTPAETQAWSALAASLEPAATVAVRLKDGKRLQGTVIQVSEDSLLLKLRTRVPVPARAIVFSDVESIERRKFGWSPGTKVLTGIGVSFGVVALAALIALGAYAD